MVNGGRPPFPNQMAKAVEIVIAMLAAAKHKPVLMILENFPTLFYRYRL